MEDELGEVVCTAPIENDRHAEEFKFFSNCNNIKGVRFKFFLIYLVFAVWGLGLCVGFSLMWYVGFSLWGPLLLWSMGSRALGLQ